MTLIEAVEILRQHNVWRRDNSGDVPETDSKLLGQAIEKVCECVPSLVDSLEWMIESDETNEGDEPMEEHGGMSWNEINAYWIEGLNNARSALSKANQS